MSSTAIPRKTQAARDLLDGPRTALPAPLRMLLINVDGRRNLAELQDIAKALKLDPQVLAQFQRNGLIEGIPRALDTRPAAAPPPPAAAAAAPAQAVATAASTSSDDLRRLMRAKMFAFDLACRMLAGRDAELRASAREVNSESRFLDWLAEASARIEAASDAERAQLFRERVAQAAV